MLCAVCVSVSEIRNCFPAWHPFWEYFVASILGVFRVLGIFRGIHSGSVSLHPFWECFMASVLGMFPGIHVGGVSCYPCWDGFMAPILGSHFASVPWHSFLDCFVEPVRGVSWKLFWARRVMFLCGHFGSVSWHPQTIELALNSNQVIKILSLKWRSKWLYPSSTCSPPTLPSSRSAVCRHPAAVYNWHWLRKCHASNGRVQEWQGSRVHNFHEALPCGQVRMVSWWGLACSRESQPRHTMPCDLCCSQLSAFQCQYLGCR